MADRPLRPTLLDLALTRRTFLKGGLAGLAVVWARPALALPEETKPAGAPTIAHDTQDRILVPEGYDFEVLLRWGDPVLPGAPTFDPKAQTEASQGKQFGFNCDYIAFVPLADDRALLVVNHEYSQRDMMFAGAQKTTFTPASLATELAAHGLSIVEVAHGADGRWRPAKEPGKLNRRITPLTPMQLAGPAAGHALLRTSADPEGRRVLGTISNCSGGRTPWGTVLTCEENFDLYFEGALPTEGIDPRIAAWHKRYLIGSPLEYPGTSSADRRFDLSKEPHESFRFGWVVEIDPLNPSSTPIKRTALGRIKHEAANTRVAKSGQVAAYMGDDDRFEYLYKFVSKGAWKEGMPRAEAGALLDEGTLYAAKFDADGTGTWIPLVHGQGPLVAGKGFTSQADVLIATRVAADAVGATPLDRPEDVEPSPATGRVYAALTNNTKRKPEQVDGVNPRARNVHGSLLEITEDGDDAAATRFRWELLVLGGDPAKAEDGARYAKGSPTWFSCPDNLVFGADGRLFATTDGQPKTIKKNDGVYLVGTEGSTRGQVRQLMSVPIGAEATGPCLSPDGKTLFVSIQHPGEDSHYDHPTSRWPDHKDDMPPRASVVALWRKDGGLVGD